MRAGLRVWIMTVAAWLVLGAAPAFAQAVPQPTTPPADNPPASDAVGPRDLQNFSLGGTVTRRADAPATATTAPAARAPATTAASPPDRSAAPAPSRSRTERAEAAPPPTVERQAAAPRSTPVSVADATPQQAPAAALAPVPASPSQSFTPSPDQSAVALTPQPKLALWPWLLAAIALGAGGAFLFWRNRRQEAFAGGPQYDAFVAPEPTARPVPRPAPQPAPMPPAAGRPGSVPVPAARPPAEPTIPGTITTRLRPNMEIGLNPLRFVVEDNRVALELEIELVNSGNAPARAVLVEATLLNAGNEQDQVLNAFFENPVGQGERIVAIPPLQRVALKTQVAIGREQVQEYQIGEKKVCVPLVAFNILYKWGNSEGQTSVAYLIGRETEGGKLAPFRLDLGPRLFRGIGLRQLPTEVRK